MSKFDFNFSEADLTSLELGDFEVVSVSDAMALPETGASSVVSSCRSSSCCGSSSCCPAAAVSAE